MQEQDTAAAAEEEEEKEDWECAGARPRTPAAEEEAPNFFTRMFGGGQAAPSPTPSPTPMPAMAGTNAPVPVAAPALSTPEAVRAAFLAGQISEAQAVQMLRGGR